jgi:hypothetical protein
MISRDDLESFLVRLGAEGATHSEVEAGTWVVHPSGMPDAQVVVHHTPPVVLLRLNVMQFPSDAAAASSLSRKLLELNASDLVHGAYGLVDNTVILTEALELQNLDYDEFLAAYDSLVLALASHVKALAPFREVR